MGYHALSQNPRGSWAWDMIQSAWVRRRCEGSKLGGYVQETGRM